MRFLGIIATEQPYPNLKLLIASNPRIRSLVLSTFPKTELLQFISEQLVELQSLYLTCDESNPTEHDTPVNFASVDTLSIDETDSCPSTLPLTFDRLNRAEFSTYGIDEKKAQTLLFELPAIGTSEQRSTGTIPDEWKAERSPYGLDITFSRQAQPDAPPSAQPDGANKLGALVSGLFKTASKLGDKLKQRYGKQ